ncbi:serine/threonine-protein phosphatase 7 long form protein [Trifolium repens]|nr:serine/threonine-protein phosphatase 7 long form protein [Trifolium repens]KAK2387306.1 serine/threonine-protein phosphatase 7 long form protein [Trifolium repens]
MMNEPIMEVRDDFMLSPAGDNKPTFRTAHFLKPIASSIEEPSFKCNPFSSSSSVFDPNEWPLKIHFNGWRYPHTKWVRWVDQLQLKYETLWKKVGIFEAIMSTKCRITKYKDLLYGIVEKWCSETNTFVFPFGEATITLEDVMVLGGYPILGDPVFTSLEDHEMREVENKLNHARNQLYKTKSGMPRTSLWMNNFIDCKGSEIEHEAFLATWLSIFVFPHKRMFVKKSLFPIAIHLARGNNIALAPAVLASIYRDLTLFKKTIVDLSKFPVGSDRYPVEVTLPSPFYLVQIWVWERFKNLQPQPMLINRGDPLLFRWRHVKDFEIDNVRLALDSAMDDFHWRPYVRSFDKCGMFYPNDEILVPFMKDLDKKMLSFVMCLRVSELVGFDCIEKYLPHRVAMQFGIDQDVPSFVPRFNETKEIAWNNYCRPISDKHLYFPSRFFEADVTSRYSRWWKQSVLASNNFVKKIVQRKRSASSRKQRANVGKANRSGNDVGVPPGFPPNLVDSLTFAKLCDDGSKPKTRKVEEFYADGHHENSVHNCLKSYKNIFYADVEYKSGGKIHESKHLLSLCCSGSSDYHGKILPLKRPVSAENVEPSIESLDKIVEGPNGCKAARMSSDKICLSETQGKSKSFSLRKKVSSFNKVTVVQHDLQLHSDMAAQAKGKETVEEKESDHEVLILLKEQCLKNQEELARLAKQQEEILRLMNLREKRDEELRQLLTSVLRNQQAPSSAS